MSARTARPSSAAAFTTTRPRHPVPRAATAVPGVVATRFGASSPVLGDALVGGRSTAAGPAHLAEARDPVPRQVRRSGEVPPP